MHRICVRFAALSLAVVLASPSTSHAEPIRLESGPEESGETTGLAVSCTLTTGAAGALSFIWTPPEELQTMAWKIPAASCIQCPEPAALKPRNLTFRMRWFKPCAAQVEVSIVGAMPGNGCLVPNPDQVLCGPTTQAISTPAAGTLSYAVPFPTGCCIQGDAFVFVRFTGLGACATSTSPGLGASTTACVPCEQFVTASNIFPTSTEWCSIGATTSTWFSLLTDCCSITPTVPRSWGSIKLYYR